MKTILLAEDHHELRESMACLLRRQGHNVVATDNGADALCVLNKQPPPDLLILDIAMPGLDGYAVLRAIGPSAPPVVVTTGQAVLDETQFPGKVTRVLAKPFEPEVLVRTVTEILEQSQHG